MKIALASVGAVVLTKRISNTAREISAYVCAEIS